MKTWVLIVASFFACLAGPASGQALMPSPAVQQCLDDYAGFPIHGPIYGVKCSHSNPNNGKSVDISTEIEWCTDPGCNIRKYWRRNCNEGIGCVVTWCPDVERQKCTQTTTAPPHEIRPAMPASSTGSQSLWFLEGRAPAVS